MGSGNDSILGVAHAPTALRGNGETSHAPVSVQICDSQVPAAADAVIGQCTYYYRPLHEEYANKNTLDGVRAWAAGYDWWGQKEVVEKLLGERETLIQASSSSPNWSRHASFMMRHIGCQHRPPDYYVSYGYYYCSTYGAQLAPRLSQSGKLWLQIARKLLQKNMEKGLRENMLGTTISIPSTRFPKRGFGLECPRLALEISTEKFKKFAYGTHVPAYLDAGLTELPYGDLIKIGRQPKIGDLVFSKDGLKQAGESTIEVVPAKVNQHMEDAGQAANDALERLQRLFK